MWDEAPQCGSQTPLCTIHTSCLSDNWEASTGWKSVVPQATKERPMWCLLNTLEIVQNSWIIILNWRNCREIGNNSGILRDCTITSMLPCQLSYRLVPLANRFLLRLLSLCILTANGIPSVRRLELGSILTVYRTHVTFEPSICCSLSRVSCSSVAEHPTGKQKIMGSNPAGYQLFLGNEFNIDRSF